MFFCSGVVLPPPVIATHAHYFVVKFVCTSHETTQPISLLFDLRELLYKTVIIMRLLLYAYTERVILPLISLGILQGYFISTR